MILRILHWMPQFVHSWAIAIFHVLIVKHTCWMCMHEWYTWHDMDHLRIDHGMCDPCTIKAENYRRVMRGVHPTTNHSWSES